MFHFSVGINTENRDELTANSLVLGSAVLFFIAQLYTVKLTEAIIKYSLVECPRSCVVIVILIRFSESVNLDISCAI